MKKNRKKKSWRDKSLKPRHFLKSMKIRIFWRNPEVSIFFSYFFMNFINNFVFLNQPPPVALSISAAILQAVSWFSIQRGSVARSQFLSRSLSPLVCLKLAPSFTVVTPAQVYLHKLILFPICCYHSIEIIARLSNSRVMLYEMCFALYLVS